MYKTKCPRASRSHPNSDLTTEIVQQLGVVGHVDAEGGNDSND